MDRQTINIETAIQHFKGEVYSARLWLDTFGPRGKQRDRRPLHDVELFERRLAFRQWVVEQLEASQKRK